MLRAEAEQILRTIPPRDAATIFNRGMDLIRAGWPEVLYPLARNAARRFPDNARIHQLHGLAARGSQRSEAALAAFAAAARLAPADPLIAHSHARAALEAGSPAIALFDRAHALAPADGDVLLGRAAAQFQAGQADAAMRELADILAANPLWLAGHRSLAHLRGQHGLAPNAAISTAIAANPRNAALHQLAINTLLESRDLPSAAKAAAAARSALGDVPWLALITAHIASEADEGATAEQLFSSLPAPTDVHTASLHVRHHLRAHRAECAAPLLDRWVGNDPQYLLWPYRSIAWRILDDPRHAWLEADPRLVGVYDLAGEVGDMAVLAEHLRGLHLAQAAPLDQSVIGGTQTDGNLLLRTDPALVRLRSAIERAVVRHLAQLPPPLAGHPTLIAHRDPLRIAGSWSVRLTDRGHHSDHVHSQGWLSSAFYAALPASMATEGSGAAEGWLSLGEARDLVPELSPLRLIEPRPGRLVLFPSVMWHGTRPFPDGERLTVALDIARPQQS